MPPARRSLTRTRPPAKDVSVKVSPALKKKWDHLRASIDAARSQGAEAFDELYEAAAEVVDSDPPLYVIGGFKTVGEFCKQVLGEGERTARRNMRVARFATPKEEATYGVHLLDAAIGHLEALAGKPIATLPVAFDRLKVEVVRGGAKKKLPLAHATVVEVNGATKRLLAKKRGEHPRREAEQVLRAALDATAVLAKVGIHERNGLVSFTQVPIAALASFARRIASANIDVAPAERKKRVGPRRPQRRPA